MRCPRSLLPTNPSSTAGRWPTSELLPGGRVDLDDVSKLSCRGAAAEQIDEAAEPGRGGVVPRGWKPAELAGRHCAVATITESEEAVGRGQTSEQQHATTAECGGRWILKRAAERSGDAFDELHRSRLAVVVRSTTVAASPRRPVWPQPARDQQEPRRDECEARPPHCADLQHRGGVHPRESLPSTTRPAARQRTPSCREASRSATRRHCRDSSVSLMRRR